MTPLTLCTHLHTPSHALRLERWDEDSVFIFDGIVNGLKFVDPLVDVLSCDRQNTVPASRSITVRKLIK